MRKALIVAGWLAATAATTAVAYVAVGAAGARVNDRPLSVVVADSSTTSTASATTTSTGTTSDSSPSTNTTSATTSTTSTTPAPTTTASTSPTTGTTAAAWQQQTIASTGGTVVVSFRGEEVRLESVAAAAGYTSSIEDEGPGEVRVEFEGQLRVEIRARVRDGQLIIEIDEDD
jgi:hypothetical protein